MNFEFYCLQNWLYDQTYTSWKIIIEMNKEVKVQTKLEIIEWVTPVSLHFTKTEIIKNSHLLTHNCDKKYWISDDQEGEVMKQIQSVRKYTYFRDV